MKHSAELDRLAMAFGDVRRDDPALDPEARLGKHGFCLLTVPDLTADGCVWAVVLLHDTGQWLAGTVPQEPDTAAVRREFAAALVGKYEPSPFVENTFPAAVPDAPPLPPAAEPFGDPWGGPDPHGNEPTVSPAAAPPPEKTPLEKIKAAYFVQLQSHCGKFSSDDFRRGVEGALIGARAPVPHPRGWDVGGYRSALEDLEEHQRTGCPGQDQCTLRDMAAGRFFSPTEEEPAAAPDGPPSPSPTVSGNVTAGGAPGASVPAGASGGTTNGGAAGIFCSNCARAMTQKQQADSQRAGGGTLCPPCLRGRQPAAVA